MNDIWLSINDSIPGIVAFLANVDILVLLSVWFLLTLFFYTVGRDVPATLITASFFTFFFLQIPTGFMEWAIAQVNQPAYLVYAVVFLITAAILTFLLFRSPFFEPLNVPTGKELIPFSFVLTGLWTIMLIQVFPAELKELTSPAFQTLFFGAYSNLGWGIVAPLTLIKFLKGGE